MCTVSWEWKQSSKPEQSELQIYFNRDERRSREIALAPTIIDAGITQLLCPIDPQSQGTWIATNQAGVTVALLNNYSVPIDPEKNYQSRGKLVTEVALGTSLDMAMSNVYASVSQHHYPAFSLLIWDHTTQQTRLFTWNEEMLDHQQPIENFLTSSSWNTDAVQAYRREQFLKQVVHGNTPANEFHSTTPEGMEKESVFMSRELTQTVSLTNIHVTSEMVTMDYYDRSTDQTSTHTMPLQPA